MEKTTTTLSVSKPIYLKFKELCKSRFSSVTKEFNQFMKKQIEQEGKHDN